MRDSPHTLALWRRHWEIPALTNASLRYLHNGPFFGTAISVQSGCFAAPKLQIIPITGPITVTLPMNFVRQQTFLSFLVSSPRSVGTEKNALQLVRSDVHVLPHECCDILNDTFSFFQQSQQLCHFYHTQFFSLWILSFLTGWALAN